MTENFKLSSVSFFCPAYNDEGNLPNLIPTVFDFLKENSQKFEIVIIDDGAKDKTGEVAEEMARKFPNTRVVHHIKNKGYTATLKEGFENGKYDYIMYTDGDNQYDVMDSVPYLHFLKDNDVIAGYAIKKNSDPSGAFIDAELILKANKIGFKIAQFPVVHYKRKTGIASGSKPKLILNTIKDMIKLRLGLL